MTANGPTRFTAIHVGGWRDDAECTRHDPILWDGTLLLDEGKEPEADRERRHRQAKAICWNKCDVRAQCAADVDWRLDDGVRGGHLLPSRTAYAGGNASARDLELVKLLRAGIPLDVAAPQADRLARGTGRPKAAS